MAFDRRVELVHENDSAKRLFDQLVGLRPRLADVVAAEVRTADLLDLGVAHDPHQIPPDGSPVASQVDAVASVPRYQRGSHTSQHYDSHICTVPVHLAYSPWRCARRADQGGQASRGHGVSGCVNMLENRPCEHVGCTLGSRRCENVALQGE